MIRGSLKAYCTLLLLSLSLALPLSATVEKKCTANLSRGAAKQNFPPEDQPPPIPAKESHNASGNLDSCLDSQQEEGGGKAEQMSALAHEAASAASTKAGADVDTAPVSVAGLDDESDDNGPSSGEEGYIPERYIVGCGGDRVEAARR